MVNLPITSDIYARAPAIAARLVEATTHAQAVIVGDDDETEKAWARFSLAGKSIYVGHEHVDGPMTSFLDGTVRSGDRRQLAHERVALVRMRSAVAILLRTALQSCGPAEVDAMEAASSVTTTGTGALYNGILDLTSSAFLDDFLRISSLAAVDPRILDVATPAVWITDAAAAREIVNDVARRRGVGLRAELRELVAAGGTVGMIGLLTAQLADVAGIDATSPWAGVVALPAIERVIQRNLAAMHNMARTVTLDAQRRALGTGMGARIVSELDAVLSLLAELPTRHISDASIDVGSAAVRMDVRSARKSQRARPRISADQLYARTGIVTADIIGARVYADADNVLHDGSLAELLPHAEASYSHAENGRIRLKPAHHESIERFLAGEFSSGDPTKDVEERVQLVAVASAIRNVYHEFMHSTGPSDKAAMDADHAMAFPGYRIVGEGLNELATRMFFDDYLVESGLAAVDPRIREVQLPDTYSAEVAAITILTQVAAERSGMDHAEVVRMLAGHGRADGPLEALTVLFLTRDMTASDPVVAQRLAIPAVRHAIETTLAEFERTIPECRGAAELAEAGRTAGWCAVAEVDRALAALARPPQRGPVE